jgi:general stress protein YciG
MSETTTTEKPTGKQKRGFALWDKDRLKETSSRGGASVAKEKRSFSQSRELAKKAGQRGGSNVGADQRTFSRDRDKAVEAGRKGGVSTWKRKQPKA